MPTSKFEQEKRGLDKRSKTGQPGRRKADNALFFSEARYRALFRDNPTMIFTLDTSWTIISANPFGASRMGYAAEELEGQSVLKLFHEDDRTAVADQLLRCLKNPSEVHRWQFRKIRKDGGVLWVEEIAQAVYDLNGELNLLVVCQDVTERKRAEQDLEEQEALLRNVLETLPIGVWIIDAQGTIVHGNQAGQRIWSGARYVGIEQYGEYKGWWADTGKSIEPQEWAAARAVLKGETSLDEEIDIESFDGTRKRILHSAVPLRDSCQRITGAVIINQDISARVEAEHALRRQEADLRKAQEIAKLGSWTYDMSGRISWSDELYRIYGASPETFTPNADSFLDLIHPDDRSAMQAWIDAFSAGERPGELVFRTILPDGTVRFISGRGELVADFGDRQIHLAGTAQDITERKQAEEALARSESAFRATFEQAAVGMARVATDGRWLQVNQRLCDIVGYARDELLTLTFQDITHPDDVDADSGHLLQALAGDLNSYSKEMRFIRKDRSIVWINFTVGLVRDSVGAPAYAICVVEEITKRKRAEEALAEKQRLLEEVNLSLEQRVAETVLESRKKDEILIQQGRQAAMGEMIGNIAHQWRQPLNTLGLIVQELQMTYGRDEFNKETLETSVKKAMGLITHMSKTIEDFRNYFKPEKEKMPFNVNQAVATTLSLVEPSFKNLDINIEVIEKDDTDIYGYANEYSQVLLNILLNCKDAFEECDVDKRRVIVITVFKENNNSVVTVSDNAGGIPEKVIGKIFDPYFSTKGPDKGTGIGLFMAKTIIEKNMGGRLAVRNAADGAEFRIEV
ncbi:MAG: hypothetical protein A2075_02760 [Geobacteraceae bacterium GWC2_58_44]|nr:MAG: hypothetical protein A2075_02760 [Geobacteraceae bacterium GWC2_58_44]HBG05161.1 hypothetical protein [Geobacter sp.]